MHLSIGWLDQRPKNCMISRSSEPCRLRELWFFSGYNNKWSKSRGLTWSRCFCRKRETEQIESQERKRIVKFEFNEGLSCKVKILSHIDIASFTMLAYLILYYL